MHRGDRGAQPGAGSRAGDVLTRTAADEHQQQREQDSRPPHEAEARLREKNSPTGSTYRAAMGPMIAISNT